MEETKKKIKKENRTRTNLVDKLGDFLLESLHHIDQPFNFMSLVMVNGTLSADRLLVCLAVSVDLLLRMFFTTSDPRYRATYTSWFHGLIK